jgi:hypothetical protein
VIGILKHKGIYEKWWLGKYCHPANSNCEFKKVSKIIMHGPPSFVYGQIDMVYEDGSMDIVNGGLSVYKPRKSDVIVREEAK